MASVAYVDFTELRIPNEYIITGLVYWVLSIFVELICGSQFIVANIISSLIAAAALFIASLLCKICIRGSIGAGDIKLFVVMGLLLGLDGIWSAIFLSLVLSFITAIYFLITKRKGKKDAMAFGPALAIGTWLPPLPPPIGRPVREFLKICSKPRNLTTPEYTLGAKRRPPL